MAGFNCNSRLRFRDPASRPIVVPLQLRRHVDHLQLHAARSSQLVCLLLFVVCLSPSTCRTRTDGIRWRCVPRCAVLANLVWILACRWACPVGRNSRAAFPHSRLSFFISPRRAIRGFLACPSRFPRIPICYRSVHRGNLTGNSFTRRYAARVKMLGWNYGGGMKEDYDDVV
jgi:hypothetical protein